jgi:Flp pilus assembly pilin Flp
VKKFWTGEPAATAIEYDLIATVVSPAVIATVKNAFNAKFTSIESAPK